VVPGVELQATVLDNVLLGRALRHPWWLVPAEALVVLMIGLIVGPALRWLRGGWGAAAALVLALVYFGVTPLLFTRAGLALGGLYPLMALVLCTAGGAGSPPVAGEGEKRERRAPVRPDVNPPDRD